MQDFDETTFQTLLAEDVDAATAYAASTPDPPPRGNSGSQIGMAIGLVAYIVYLIFAP